MRRVAVPVAVIKHLVIDATRVNLRYRGFTGKLAEDAAYPVEFTRSFSTSRLISDKQHCDALKAVNLFLLVAMSIFRFTYGTDFLDLSRISEPPEVSQGAYSGVTESPRDSMQEVEYVYKRTYKRRSYFIPLGFKELRRGHKL